MPYEQNKMKVFYEDKQNVSWALQVFPWGFPVWHFVSFQDYIGAWPC
jgi:hypothetical protein